VKHTVHQAARDAARDVLARREGLNAAKAAYRRAVAVYAGFRFHDLRHQAITELAESGASDATVMALAGHLSRAMMEHYSHVRMEAKRAAVEGLATGLIGSEPRTQRESLTESVQ
jgi:integrase